MSISISMSCPSMFEPISLALAELASTKTDHETSTPPPIIPTETSTESWNQTFPSPFFKGTCQHPITASPSSPSRVTFHYQPNENENENEHQHEDKHQSQPQSQSQSRPLLPHHAIYSLITSLFTAITFHHAATPTATSASSAASSAASASLSASASPCRSRIYMMTLTPLQIQWFHILLVHYMTCQHQHQHQHQHQQHQPTWDDTTDILMMHGSESESHDTYGEMHEKRIEWLEKHAQQQQQQQLKDVECQHMHEQVMPVTIPVTSTTAVKNQNMFQTYFQKYKGQHQPTPVMMPVWDQWWAFIGAFLGILGPAFLNFKILPSYMSKPDLGIMIASFGATAVLCFSAIGSDLSQPRNVIGGHMLSAIVGVSVHQIIPNEYVFIACALAVAIAIAVMNATKTLHPPGGATAMIAVLPNNAIHDLGFLYVLIPVGTGAVLMLLIALIINNMPRRRTWPRFWI